MAKKKATKKQQRRKQLKRQLVERSRSRGANQPLYFVRRCLALESRVRITKVFQWQIRTLKRLGGAAEQTAAHMENDLNSGKEVVIRPYSEQQVVRDIVEAFLRSGNSVDLQKCFNNSASLAQFEERIQYVEGHALGESNFLIDHAWNSCGDFHFDVTAELALKTSFYGYLASQVLGGIDVPLGFYTHAIQVDDSIKLRTQTISI